MFSGSAVAGAKVLHIVSVYSVSNGGERQLRRQIFHLCKKFGLAVITAIGVVGYVIWVFEFGRNNKLVTKAGLSNEGLNRSEEHTSELQSHHDLHSSPTRRSSDLESPAYRQRLLRKQWRRTPASSPNFPSLQKVRSCSDNSDRRCWLRNLGFRIRS